MPTIFRKEYLLVSIVEIHDYALFQTSHVNLGTIEMIIYVLNDMLKLGMVTLPLKKRKKPLLDNRQGFSEWAAIW